MKTFRQLQTEILRFFDLAQEVDEAPTGADVELVKSGINQANATRVTEEQWKFMLSGEFTLTTVAGTQDYIFPNANLNRIHYLWNDTDKTFAVEIPDRALPTTMIDFNQTVANDIRNTFSLRKNGSMVPVQPPIPSVLTLTTAGSEPNNPALYIEGIDANGVAISETVMKNGTTIQVFAQITYYAKTGDFATALVLSAGATVLLSLDVTEYAKSFTLIHFNTIPAADKTFKYRFFRLPRVLTRDFDTPDLPYPLSNIIVYDVLLDLATFNELDSESVGVWRDKQQQLLINLYMEKLAGNVVGGDTMEIGAKLTVS